ncbi:MAG: hypothetical protein JWQ01_1397 [Massilia sp.]|nr:hypothetical protein [Massilia sp.]
MTEEYEIPDLAQTAGKSIGRTLRNVLLFFAVLGVGLSWLTRSIDPLVAALVLWFITTFFSIFFLNGRYRKKLQNNWDAHSFEWYRRTFPTQMDGNGRLRCRHCGDGRIRVQNLMNNTFTRAHSCVQCGKTLYYSPEKL